MVTVLGLAFVLEWFGASRAKTAAKNLIAHSGIPNIAAAVRFLESHGDADTAHIRALANALADVTEIDDARSIVLSAEVTAALYAGFFHQA